MHSLQFSVIMPVLPLVPESGEDGLSYVVFFGHKKRIYVCLIFCRARVVYMYFHYNHHIISFSQQLARRGKQIRCTQLIQFKQ